MGWVWIVPDKGLLRDVLVSGEVMVVGGVMAPDWDLVEIGGEAESSG